MRVVGETAEFATARGVIPIVNEVRVDVLVVAVAVEGEIRNLKARGIDLDANIEIGSFRVTAQLLNVFRLRAINAVTTADLVGLGGGKAVGRNALGRGEPLGFIRVLYLSVLADGGVESGVKVALRVRNVTYSRAFDARLARILRTVTRQTYADFVLRVAQRLFGGGFSAKEVDVDVRIGAALRVIAFTGHAFRTLHVIPFGEGRVVLLECSVAVDAFLVIKGIIGILRRNAWLLVVAVARVIDTGQNGGRTVGQGGAIQINTHNAFLRIIAPNIFAVNNVGFVADTSVGAHLALAVAKFIIRTVPKFQVILSRNHLFRDR
jgi:hypothetical protein